MRTQVFNKLTLTVKGKTQMFGQNGVGFSNKCVFIFEPKIEVFCKSYKHWFSAKFTHKRHQNIYTQTFFKTKRLAQGP